MYDDDFSEDFWNTVYFCGEPTVYGGLNFAKDLILSNLLLRFLLQYFSGISIFRHSFSLAIGSILLYHHVGSAFIWILGITVSSYMLMLLIPYVISKFKSLIVSTVVICFLLLCEIYAVNPKMWHQIRGIQMILAMKIISVAVELDRGLYKEMLNPVEFGGYMFCPSNCLLGPWISYGSYNNYLNVKFLSKRWFKIIGANLVLALVSLLLSNCLVPWYINDDSSKWLLAYRDAQAFRMSHYFVSYMSMVSMVCAGFGLANDCTSEIEITKPHRIEVPRSLVQVVICWNIPMHQWLKKYVFKTCQVYGNFVAIFVTYAVSSILHGFNFQLSAVLISIGIFSYVEYNFRFKVASALEVCCLANPCTKQCNHTSKGNSILAYLLNFLFSIIAIMHLAYLGVMFEASFTVQESGYSFQHTLSKWENLDYFSHGFVSFFYIVFLMM